ncbi:MAG: YraN family protein [Ignavibacteria bacterium]|jgi:putative endonuclease|nr:YraN family protein [Ignavibacteria bacterium]
MNDNTQNNLYNKNIGNKGEDIAVKFLEDKGYLIIERNFKFGKEGEIDIVAKDKNTLVFVEVKTRSNHNFGDPVLAISQKKRRLWSLAANGYMLKNNIHNQECRLDLIAIDLISETPQITHIENAVF